MSRFQPARVMMNWSIEVELGTTANPKFDLFDKSSDRKVLLIGNGPSAIKAESIENQYDIVVRFNKFSDKPGVGKRTDIWACCLNNDVIKGVCDNAPKTNPQIVVLVQHDRPDADLATCADKIRRAGVKVSIATKDDRETLRKELEVNPTTGAVMAWHYIRNGCVPTLIGFDQIWGETGKYWSNEKITQFHDPKVESAWFRSMVCERKVVGFNGHRKNRVVGAWHIAMMNEWVSMVTEQETRLIKSGLLKATEKVIVGIAGDDDVSKWKMSPELASKAVVVRGRLEDYEHLTLSVLHKESRTNDDFKAWYMHTKGISGHGDKEAIRDWRLVMEHFVIDRYEDCIAALSSCDACGVNKRPSPPHFSGNFWWANSSHLKRLPLITDKSRGFAEMWIGGGKARLFELHSCDVYYDKTYPESRYVLQSI